jgi:localization factor PodJL
VARDPEKAVLWMARAAGQGLAPAQYRFANLTEKGIGTAKDVNAARGMYEQAAAAGNVQAMHNLGVIYAEGGLGQPDMAVASVWFRKAAEYGVKDSQYNLAILYARGISVSQDLAESYLWFSLAAKQGDKDAESKRDQVGARLDAGKAAELSVRADTWKPKAAPIEANEVASPPGGWDEPGKPV